MKHVFRMSVFLCIGVLATSLFGQIPEQIPEAPATQGVEPQEITPEMRTIIEGNRAFESDDYQAAVDAYMSLNTLALPPYAQNRLGLSLFMLSRFAEAGSILRMATRREKDLSAGFNNLGVLDYSQQEFKDAEGRFKDALEHDPDNRILQHNLRAAKYARENGRRIRPLLAAERAEDPLLIDLRDGDVAQVTILMPADVLAEADLISKRADSFLARKMYEDAIIEYRRGIDLDRYNASLTNRLGIAYHQSQRLKDAERQYKNALKINPYYVQALNNLGSIEYSRGNYRRAVGYYADALDVRSESPTILQNIGSCFFAMELWEKGLRAYIHALRLDPALFDARSGFGTLIQTAQRNESMVNFYLAKAFASSGDLDRTMSFLYRAVEEGFDEADLLNDPVFEILAEDERFVRLLGSFGER